MKRARGCIHRQKFVHICGRFFELSRFINNPLRLMLHSSPKFLQLLEKVISISAIVAETSKRLLKRARGCIHCIIKSPTVSDRTAKLNTLLEKFISITF